MKIVFGIYHPGEMAAGINSYSDTVTVSVESGDPGGDGYEFTEHMLDALKEWFYGAGVTVAEG